MELDFSEEINNRAAASEENPDIEKHYFKSKDEALRDAKKLGLKGYHEHKTKDGSSVFMAGPDHQSFIKKHKELTK